MSGAFDEFARQHAETKQQTERLQADAPSEWFALKSFAEELAAGGKGIEGYQFEWAADVYGARLVLGPVAALFLERERHGRVDRCVRFGRKPIGHNQVQVEESPLQGVVWTLLPTITGDNIEWMIAEVNAQLSKQVKFSSSDLAGEVGIRLAKFLIEYNKHYQKWSAV